MLVGIDAVLDVDASETVTLSYEVNDGGSFTNLLDTQEGGGTAGITNTGGYAKARRYAAPNTEGQFFQIKVAVTLNASKGSDRPEIRELWAFGYSHPDHTDVIELDIHASEDAETFDGLGQGRSAGEIERLWRLWQNDGTVITAEIVDYEESRTTRFKVVGVNSTTTELEEGPGANTRRNAVCKVQLMRLDYANAYAAA